MGCSCRMNLETLGYRENDDREVEAEAKTSWPT
jgi:hypothetical protein